MVDVLREDRGRLLADEGRQPEKRDGDGQRNGEVIYPDAREERGPSRNKKPFEDVDQVRRVG